MKTIRTYTSRIEQFLKVMDDLLVAVGSKIL